MQRLAMQRSAKRLAAVLRPRVSQIEPGWSALQDAGGAAACYAVPAAGFVRQSASRAPAWGRVTPPPDELPAEQASSEPAQAAVELAEVEAEAEADFDSSSSSISSSSNSSSSDFTLATLPLGRGLHEACSVEGRRWVFETGRLARLADGACMVQTGGTTVLAGAVCDSQFNSRRDALKPQFEVDYREKLYAVGRIPGTYNKREGAPKEHEMLAGRAIDRALRPLFPKGFNYASQIYASVLSADGEQDPDVLAINAASAALTCSDIPWLGPVAAVRVVLTRDGQLLANPAAAVAEAAGTAFSLLVACTADRVVMLEGEGAELPEQEFVRAVRHGVQAAQALLAPQQQLAARTGRKKRRVQLAGADPTAAQKVFERALPAVERVLRSPHLDKNTRTQALQAAKAEVLEGFRASGSFRTEFARVPGSGCVSQSDLDHAFTAVVGSVMRRLALQDGWRCDGRGLVDLRPVHCELDAIPVVHGSALFTRGETQSLCTVTVGGRGDQQRTESLLGGESSKGLFVNYSFTGLAINETSASGMRRELGHSSLVERALLPAMPDVADFPFTLRLNADTLASSGSSSMAAVCGGSLALVDAGVPLCSLVAGVSIGLLQQEGWSGAAGEAGGEPAGQPAEAVPEEFGQYELLTDLLGMEDQLGDMDFKVAGTRRGITACQLDVKVPGGVPVEVLEEAALASRRARLQILDTMQRAVPHERGDHAPVFGSVTVPEGMLGRVIGEKGAKLKELEEGSGARINVGPGGLIHIFAPSASQYEDVRTRLLDAAGETIKEGQVYRVRVVGLRDFGAFVELEQTGMRCLLHISEIDTQRIRAVEDALKVGQTLEVLCLGKDARGNVRLSRKALLQQLNAQRTAAASAAAGDALEADR